MKFLKVFALSISISSLANAQQTITTNLIVSNGNAQSSPYERNIGVHLWGDAGFGMELHHRDGLYGTALFTRGSHEKIWLGNYGTSTGQQGQFIPWMTLVNGNVGIGTTTPTVPLAVMCSGAGIADFRSSSSGNTQVVVSNALGSIGVGIGAVTKHGFLYSNTGNVFFGADGAPTMSVIGMNNGNVGIGTEDTRGFKLAVNGNVLCEKVVVKLKANWPDYVFNASYKLPSLSELEQYIKQHRHLPDVPSAEEVEKDGLSVGENQAVLLKKIEELTLYVIEQNKKLEEQQKLIKDQQEQLKEVKQQIRTLAK